MRVLRSHPMLKGCRLFWLGGGIDVARNRAAGGVGTVTNAAADRVGRFYGLKWTGASTADNVTWGNGTDLGLRTAGLTVIARCRVDGDNGAGANAQGLVSCKNGDYATSSAGFALYWVKDSVTNIGYVFSLYSTVGFGGFYYAYAGSAFAGAGEYGKERVVAGVYDRVSNGPRVYVDGREYTTLGDNGGFGGTAANTIAWDVASASPLKFGQIAGESYPLNGALSYVAVFDRALSPGEIARWSRTDRLPFLQDEEELFTLAASTTYRTRVGAGTAYAPGGPVTYSTVVDALAYVGGDLTVDPAADAAPTYANVVGAGQHYVGDIPELVRYHNVVKAASVLTQYGTVKYANVVRVGQRRRSLIDGRADVLAQGRYRR